MRVAHFVQRYPPALGGSEAFFARLSRYLAAAGEQVTVFTTAALSVDAFWSPHAPCVPAGTAVEDDVEVRRYPLWRFRGRRYLLKPLSLVAYPPWQCLTVPCNPISRGMWADAGRAAGIDVVHATAFPYAWPIACALRLARRLGVPFFLTPFLHLGDPSDPRDRTRRAYLSAPFRYLLRSADRIFVQTEMERQALLGLGLGDEKLLPLGMGVDPDECTGGDREKVRRQWNVGEGTVVVGHLANNSVEKGTVDLVRATGVLGARGRDALLVLAGPEMPNFQRFWKGYTPAGRVLRLGPLDDVQKRDFFAGIDAFALPSRSDSFGLVLLEAWANGVPNVAYRAGGPAEVIRHEEDGLLVPCGDVPALAEALDRLITDDLLRHHLGAAGRLRTQEGFRWQDKLDHVRDAYRSRLSEPGASATGLTRRPTAQRRQTPCDPSHLISPSPLAEINPALRDELKRDEKRRKHGMR